MQIQAAQSRQVPPQCPEPLQVEDAAFGGRLLFVDLFAEALFSSFHQGPKVVVVDKALKTMREMEEDMDKRAESLLDKNKRQPQKNSGGKILHSRRFRWTST